MVETHVLQLLLEYYLRANMAVTLVLRATESNIARKHGGPPLSLQEHLTTKSPEFLKSEASRGTATQGSMLGSGKMQS